MSFFYDLSTRAKLLLSFFAVILINFGIFLTSINSMVYNRNVTLLVNEVLIDSYGRISRTQQAAADTNLSFLRGLNTTDTSYTAAHIKQDVDSLLRELKDAVSQLNPNYFGIQEYRDACGRLTSNVDTFTRNIESQVMPLINRNETKTALDLYLREVSPAFAEINQATMALVGLQHRECTKLTIPAVDPTPIYVNSAMAILATLVAVFLAFFISNYISGAVRHQIYILERMAAGDFALHINRGNKDEFGRTHEALRNMRIALNNIIVHTKNECTQLQEEMRKLQGLSNSIVEHSAEVETQAVTVSASSEEMVSTTQAIARNCESAASSSDICKEISDRGLQQVIDAVNSIRVQSEHTRDNARKIESLAQQTNAIGSIVSTIDDIAAQTNLLALNAAIEAARAGEAGRGFAVVADEVRALASRTTASTQEISKMVKNIQDEAALATESISASVDNMDAVAEQASKTEDLLKEITSHVVEVNQQITQIATAAEQQTTATSEISGNMQTVTNATAQMTESANQQNSSMDKAHADLDSLIKDLQFFKTREDQAQHPF